MRANARAGALAVLLLALAAPGAGAVENFSRLAPQHYVPGSAADGLLAQRVIDREWGLAEDSTYNVVDVPGWKSEGWAMALSAAVPGAGQLYTGEGSGWVYMLAEAAGWTGRYLAVRKANRYDSQAAAFVGDPSDSTSGWSYARWQTYGGGDPGALERLWAGDREAYYMALINDPQYLSGFAGSQPEVTYTGFRDLRQKRDETLHRAVIVETALWLNHIVSAVDALRAARFHNLPLRQQYQLRVSERWRHGRPEMRAALVRRF